MTAGSAPSNYRAKREPNKSTPRKGGLGVLIVIAVTLALVTVSAAAIHAQHQPSHSNAACFDNSVYPLEGAHKTGLYEQATGSVGQAIPHDPCPDGYAPRQACIITSAQTDPANNTGGCAWNEKPFYWTDADLKYGPDPAADQYVAGLSLDGMPGSVQQTVCLDGVPVKVVRVDGPYKVSVHRWGVDLGKATQWAYRVTCSKGASTIAVW